MGRNVMVIGGAGYVGSHVALALLEADHRVTVFDNLSSGKKENLSSDAEFYFGDILDERDLNQAFSETKPDAVIHLAALKAAGDSMEDPGRYAHQNIGGSINIINAMVLFGVRDLVFSSTATVYGEPEYFPMDEKHPVKPNNFYGFTKLEVERILHWFDRIKGIRFAALRYFNAAGYDPRGRITGLEDNPKNLIPVVLESVIGMRGAMEVFGNDYPTPDGTGIRDYIHVSDLATAHVLALDFMQTRNRSLTCNLGSGVGSSVLEIINRTEAISGRRVPHRIVGRRKGDVARLLASFSRAKELLGWEPINSSLDVMLKTAWDVYLIKMSRLTSTIDSNAEELG